MAEPILIGAVEGLTIVGISYVALPHLLARAEAVHSCLRLLDECGRLGHQGAAEIAAGRPELSPEGQVVALRWELGRAINSAFVRDPHNLLASSVAKFAMALRYAERQTPAPRDFDAGMRIRELQGQLRRLILQRAGKRFAWRLLMSKFGGRE